MTISTGATGALRVRDPRYAGVARTNSSAGRRVAVVVKSVNTERTGQSATSVTSQEKGTFVYTDDRGPHVSHVEAPTGASVGSRRRSALTAMGDRRYVHVANTCTSASSVVDLRYVHVASRNTLVPIATKGTARAAGKRRLQAPMRCVMCAFLASGELRLRRFI